MRVLRLLALCCLPLLGACASITAGTTQTVAVDTNPQKPAECKLSNEKGTWAIPKSPGITTVSKAYGAITVSCVSPDGYAGTTSMESTTVGAAFGNIIAGGIIGAAVDMSSGAAYKYPAQVIVPMAPPAPPVPVAPLVTQPVAPLSNEMDKAVPTS
jgi:hypothetical protein